MENYENFIFTWILVKVFKLDFHRTILFELESDQREGKGVMQNNLKRDLFWKTVFEWPYLDILIILSRKQIQKKASSSYFESNKERKEKAGLRN